MIDFLMSDDLAENSVEKEFHFSDLLDYKQFTIGFQINFPESNIIRKTSEYEIYLIGNPLLKKGFTEIWNPLDIAKIQKEDTYLQRLFNEISGICGILAIDRLKKCVHLITDPLGMWPVYIYNSAEKIAVSTQLKHFIHQAYPLQWDMEAIQKFVENGYFDNHSCWWKEVKKLKAACVYTYDGKSLNYRRYQSWNDLKPVVKTTQEFCLESKQILHNHISQFDTKNKTCIIALSGGRDSRWINWVSTQYHSTESFSFGEPNCADLRIAKSISDALKQKHKEYHLNYSNWYEDRLDEFISCGGMLSLEHFHEGKLNDEIKKHSSQVLTGFMGGFAPSNGYKKNKRKHLYKNYSKEDLEFYGQRSLHPLLIDQKMRNLAAHHLYFLSRYYILATPFYHMPWLKHFYSAHKSFFQEQYRYSKTIYLDLNKKLSDIPWQKTGLPISFVFLNTVIQYTKLDVLFRKLKLWLGNKIDFYNYAKIEPQIHEQITKHLSKLKPLLPLRPTKNKSYLLRYLSLLSWQQYVSNLQNQAE
ncbi:MAG: hypothetical protein IPI50_03525 [Saprospiraceae bacterium]|nr:hypothetical protein [Saprospiraceae bacterium]